MRKRDDFVTGLDIGTTKICAMVGRKDKDGEILIEGKGVVGSRGMAKGKVVNLEQVAECIAEAVEEAEAEARIEVNSLFTGFAGRNITGIPAHTSITLSPSPRRVTEEDIFQLQESLDTSSIPSGQEAIHLIPQGFFLDGVESRTPPLGNSGTRLEADFYVIAADLSSARDIIKAVNYSGFEIEELVVGPLASSQSVLYPEEEELGVILLDIGGGTTGIALCRRGYLRYCDILTLGGNHLTSDLAIGLKTSMSYAEEIKRREGTLLFTNIGPDESIQVPHQEKSSEVIPRKLIYKIIAPRIEEILLLTYQKIRKNNTSLDSLSGVVITGGASLMEGLKEVASDIFHLPVRIGKPIRVKGLENLTEAPVFSACAGLVRFGFQWRSQEGTMSGEEVNFIKRIWGKVKGWFSDYF